MADNHKTFESTPPQPAGGNIPDPVATTGSAGRGADVGGIPKTADSALGESIDSSLPTPDVKPRNAGPTGKPADASKPTPAEPPADKATKSGENAGEDESPLNSLGRAIGSPLSGETSKEEPRR